MRWSVLWHWPEPAFVPKMDALVAIWSADMPKPHQLNMLRAHYQAPATTIHPEDMAREMGWASASAANLHYGQFAGEVARKLGLTLPGEVKDQISHFVRVKRRRSDGQVVWIMRSSVRRAIKQLGWWT